METRGAKRVNINLKVISKPAEEFREQFKLSMDKEFVAKALDISELGIGLLSKYFLPAGLILEMEIEGAPFELAQNMKIKGEIRHCKFIRSSGYQCGIKFIDIPEEYKKAIAHFIAENERRQAPRLKLSE